MLKFTTQKIWGRGAIWGWESCAKVTSSDTNWAEVLDPVGSTVAGSGPLLIKSKERGKKTKKYKKKKKVWRLNQPAYTLYSTVHFRWPESTPIIYSLQYL